jgi:type II secretory pathway component GspD/PulD (secretin)
MKQIIMRLTRLVLCVCFAGITATASPATNGETAHIRIDAAVLTVTKTAAASSLPPTGSRSDLCLGNAVSWFTITFPVAGQQNGIQYVAKFRDGLDLTLAALVNDQPVEVIQRPRIITNEAKAAQFFIVGVSEIYNTALSAGLEFPELNVTPRLMSDGTMAINIRCDADTVIRMTNNPTIGGLTISRSTINDVSATVREGEIFMVALASDPPPEQASAVRKSIHSLRVLFGRSRSKPVKNEVIVLFRAKKVSIVGRDDWGQPVFSE